MPVSIAGEITLRSFFFKVDDARLQGIQVLLLAVVIGLVIFHDLSRWTIPFRGNLGLQSDPYQLVYNQLMTTKP